MALFFAVLASVVPTRAAPVFNLPFPDTNCGSGNVTAIAGRHFVCWNILNSTHIHYSVAAQTAGWVGFGISSFPGMPGADMVVGLMDNGQFVVTDRYATEYNTPKIDFTQDIITDSWGRSNGVTWFTFVRPLLSSCASEDLQISSLETVYDGLFAFGTSDSFYYHFDNRQSVKFSLATPVSVALPPDVQTVTITLPAAPVPVTSGSYVCSYHALPSSQKFHLVQYKLTKGSADASGVLHHINMNSCPAPLAGATVNQLVDCSSAMSKCYESMLTGGYVTETLPSSVGIAIGLNATVYVVVSRHFYNPALLTGVTDLGSSYTIWYTPTLRPNEIGTFQIGTEAISVPPGVKNFRVPALCPAACTSMWESAITVTGLFFHMHTHGTSAALRVIRNGTELNQISHVSPWDPSHGSTATNYILFPGDTLWLECEFSNPLSSEIVFGGGLNQEMCYAFLTYYPKQQISGCDDFPNGYDIATPAPCVGIPVSLYPQCDMSHPRVYCPNSLGANADQWNTPDRTAAYIPAPPPLSTGCSPREYAATVIDWAIPASPSRLTVAPATPVDFVWASSGSHNVYQIASKADFDACDFSGSGTRLAAQTANGGVFSWVAPSEPGVYYFACNIGQHCAAGVKVAITVELPATTRVCNADSTWCAEYSLNGDVLEVTLTGSLGGWLGLGLPSVARQMAPADVIICAAAQSGSSLEVTDRFAEIQDTPTLDANSDLTEVSASVVDGVTTCVFRRLLVTADSQDTSITCGPTNVNWALGASTQLDYHDARGSLVIDFCAKKGGGNGSGLSAGATGAIVASVLGTAAVASGVFFWKRRQMHTGGKDRSMDRL